MGDNTGIEWADATWNPVTGCTPVSSGCDHCYARTLTERFEGTPGHYYEHGFAVQVRPHLLDPPLRWRRPRTIFVNSVSDLFHDDIAAEYIARVWAIMALAPRHTFRILTKRPARMRALLTTEPFTQAVYRQIATERDTAECGVAADTLLDALDRFGHRLVAAPLPNVQLGVSAENQKWARTRIPVLMDTPAAIRFVSAEPLLGPVDLTRWMHRDRNGHLDWVIAGGESGPGARPMHPDWVRALRDQCTAADVFFMFKQWGAWEPLPHPDADGAQLYVDRDTGTTVTDDGMWNVAGGHWWGTRRVGKRRAGRTLDGHVWDQTPPSASASRRPPAPTPHIHTAAGPSL